QSAAGVLLHADDRRPNHRRGGSRRVLLPVPQGRNPFPAPDVILACHSTWARAFRSGRRVPVSTHSRTGAKCEPHPDAIPDLTSPSRNCSDGLLISESARNHAGRFREKAIRMSTYRRTYLPLGPRVHSDLGAIAVNRVSVFALVTAHRAFTATLSGDRCER